MCGGSGSSKGGGGGPSIPLSNARTLSQLQSDASAVGLTVNKYDFDKKNIYFYKGKERIAIVEGGVKSAVNYFNNPEATFRSGRKDTGLMEEFRGTHLNRGENTKYAKRAHEYRV